MKLTTPIIAAVLGLMTAFPSVAAPLCLPVEKLVEITAQLKMYVIWKGQGRQGETCAIYANASGVWDAVLIYPDMSKACVVAEGGKSALLARGA